MYYLRYFKTQAEAIGQTANIPTVAMVEGVDKVGYFDGDTSKYYIFAADGNFVKIGKDTRIVCTYNVTSATSAFTICSNKNCFTSMEVDDTEVTPTTTYTFDTIGEHTIKFTLNYNTYISYEAFYHSSSLTSVTIPDGVTGIGYKAFMRCYNLAHIDIPDGLESISYKVFYECYNLTSVTIPDSVTYIDEYTFYYCKNLTSIKYTGTIAQWKKITRNKHCIDYAGVSTVTCSDGTCGYYET
jgi:hypothetical protein